uniref:Voltage-dependent calcium channel gamma-5 subunit n=1 Tax=Phlebotomus papatasi TaxID=29031 RepID=A0A1B0DCT3_PHLPP
TIVKSAPFFIISGVFLLVGFGLFILETCSHQHSISYFISGGLFIISGLLMLSGMIMYISIFKSEVGFKLRPKSFHQPRLFSFNYGQSFYLYIIGFICTEVVGVVNVFMYISQLQISDKRKIQCLSYNPTEMSFFRKRDDSNFENLRPILGYRKQAIQPNRPYSPGSFRKQNKCNLHSQYFTKSLNELYENDINLSVNERESIFGYPQEFPITRTLSSTSDIISNNREIFSGHDSREKDQKSSLKHFFNGSKTKAEKEEEIVKEATRKTGRHFNPHSIYFIEDNTAGTEGTIYVVEAQSNLNNHHSEISIHRSKSFQSNKLFDERELDKSMQKQFFNSDDKILSNRNQRLYSCNIDEKQRNKSIYQSRTLPRDFLKRSNQFTDEFFSGQPYHGQYRYDGAFDNTFVHKSIDDFIRLNEEPIHHNNQWPKCIPTSPSAISTKSHNLHNIPDISYRNNIFYQHPKSTIHHVPSSEEFSTFDLDQIERERRKSHANLFDYRNKYDNSKGTPVTAKESLLIFEQKTFVVIVVDRLEFHIPTSECPTTSLCFSLLGPLYGPHNKS